MISKDSTSATINENNTSYVPNWHPTISKIATITERSLSTMPKYFAISYNPLEHLIKKAYIEANERRYG